MPWGDCTGPWWMNPGRNRASAYGCCGRGMRMVGGNAARQALMGGYAPFRQPTASEEMSYLENVAMRLDEELLSVKERIEKLRSGG